MLESLFAEKSGGKKSLRKEIDSKMLAEIEEFHKISFNWNYLLNFSSKLKILSFCYFIKVYKMSTLLSIYELFIYKQ